MPEVPNRAGHPERKMGNHDTPLIDLNPGLRPSGTYIKTQDQRQPGTFGEIKDAGQYETGSAEKVHEVLSGVHDAVKRVSPGGAMVHAEVTYHPDSVKEARMKLAGELAKQPQFSEKAMPSGLGRQMAINEEAERRIPSSTTTSFKV